MFSEELNHETTLANTKSDSRYFVWFRGYGFCSVL
jgi:hypothetical protein